MWHIWQMFSWLMLKGLHCHMLDTSCSFLLISWKTACALNPSRSLASLVPTAWIRGALQRKRRLQWNRLDHMHALSLTHTHMHTYRKAATQSHKEIHRHTKHAYVQHVPIFLRQTSHSFLNTNLIKHTFTWQHCERWGEPLSKHLRIIFMRTHK